MPGNIAPEQEHNDIVKPYVIAILTRAEETNYQAGWHTADHEQRKII